MKTQKKFLRGIHPYPSATASKREKSEQENQKMNKEAKKCTIAQQTL